MAGQPARLIYPFAADPRVRPAGLSYQVQLRRRPQDLKHTLGNRHSANTYTIEHVFAYFNDAGLVPVQCGPAAMAMYCLPPTA